MAIVNYYNPSTLLELSASFVFGVDCKESLRYLGQLSNTEAFEFATLIRRGGVSFSKYEYVLDSSSGREMFPDRWDKFCEDHRWLLSNPNDLRLMSSFTSVMERITVVVDFMFSDKLSCNMVDFYWRHNPIYQIVNNRYGTDIIRAYYEMESEILNLKDPVKIKKGLVLPILKSEEDVFCYYDPMCFFPVHSYISGERCLLAENVYELVWSMLLDVGTLIYDLTESKSGVRRSLYYVLISLSLQIEKMLLNAERVKYGIIGKGILTRDRKKSVIESLKLITCLRNLKKSVGKIEKTTLRAIKNCNFIPLEDVMRMFELVVNRDEMYRSEIVVVSSFLKKKYPSLIESRKIMIESLLGKIKQSDNDKGYLTQSYLDNVNRSIEKMRKEIEEMEVFLEKDNLDGSHPTRDYVEDISESVERFSNEMEEMKASLCKTS
ncbi:hypothetical protein [Candidatus Ichthyocystis hellenicum]|uniref:hypothetical protein n=1 Tax=Candidatus Ichthyocystis hellenicum TaxID=1561003 RepID=UPI000B80D6F3|nr:hypothetical protein [Candidatus Ichthyocystis hellenicum]